VQSRILNSLTDMKALPDPEPEPAKIKPAVAAVAAIAILAIGALIGFMLVR
jgi:hypothetical protein